MAATAPLPLPPEQVPHPRLWLRQHFPRARPVTHRGVHLLVLLHRALGREPQRLDFPWRAAQRRRQRLHDRKVNAPGAIVYVVHLIFVELPVAGEKLVRVVVTGCDERRGKPCFQLRELGECLAGVPGRAPCAHRHLRSGQTPGFSQFPYSSGKFAIRPSMGHVTSQYECKRGGHAAMVVQHLMGSPRSRRSPPSLPRPASRASGRGVGSGALPPQSMHGHADWPPRSAVPAAKITPRSFARALSWKLQLGALQAFRPSRRSYRREGAPGSRPSAPGQQAGTAPSSEGHLHAAAAGNWPACAGNRTAPLTILPRRLATLLNCKRFTTLNCKRFSTTTSSKGFYA